jgi:hypothetical protein
VGQAITINKQIYVLDCGECGIEFGVPNDFDDRRRRDHKTFYCPNGHPRVYLGESDAEKIKRLEREAAAERDAKVRAYAEVEAARRVNRALRGQATKLRKRISGGVCPCCNRTFVELGRHMATKHPEYATTEVGK